MVRTRADNTCRKAVASKAPRKSLGGTSSGGGSNFSSSDSSSAHNSGAPLFNHAKMWPTPTWQRGIQCFFTKKETNGDSCSKTTSATGSFSKINDEDKENRCLAARNENGASQASSNEEPANSNSSLASSTKMSLIESDSDCSKTSSACRGKEKAKKRNHKRRVILERDSD